MLGAQVETFQKALESHKDHKYVEVLYRLSTLEPYHKQPKYLFHVPFEKFSGPLPLSSFIRFLFQWPPPWCPCWPWEWTSGDTRFSLLFSSDVSVSSVVFRRCVALAALRPPRGEHNLPWGNWLALCKDGRRCCRPWTSIKQVLMKNRQFGSVFRAHTTYTRIRVKGHSVSIRVLAT